MIFISDLRIVSLGMKEKVSRFDLTSFMFGDENMPYNWHKKLKLHAPAENSAADDGVIVGILSMMDIV